MTNYSLTKSEYTLPREVYMKTLWTIKDYPRLLSEADACLEATPNPTETPEIQRQRNLRATETKNLKYAEYLRVIRAIESALTETVAVDDRRAVLDNILYGKSWPLNKSARAYGSIKQRYIYTVAKKLTYI